MTGTTEPNLSSSGQARRAFLNGAKNVAIVAPAVAVLLNASMQMAQAYQHPNCGSGNGAGDGTPGGSNCNDNTG